MKTQSIRPKFVTSFPSSMEDGVLYISEEYETAGHRCCCGCGGKVMTPLSPVKWRLTKSSNGAVSLYPSIGNWKFTCQSHYWIRDNRVIPAGMLSKQRIEAVNARDKRDSQQYIDQTNQATKKAEQIRPAVPRQEGLMDMIVNKLRSWCK
jgi:hypothetical protein